MNEKRILKIFVFGSAILGLMVFSFLPNQKTAFAQQAFDVNEYLNYCLNNATSNLNNPQAYDEKCCKSEDLYNSSISDTDRGMIYANCQTAQKNLQTDQTATTFKPVPENLKDVDWGNVITEGYILTEADILNHLLTVYGPKGTQDIIDRFFNTEEGIEYQSQLQEENLDLYYAIFPLNVLATQPSLAPAETPLAIEEMQDIQTRLEEQTPKNICDLIVKDDDVKCRGGGADGVIAWLNCSLGNFFLRQFCNVFLAIAEGLGKVVSGVMNLEITWILNALSPATYGGFVNNAGVKAIWKFVRDFVNLFLIIGLIIVAIATIFRNKKYGWENTLWKLIVVALLVNFSLVISGMVVDVSNYLSSYFLNLTESENQNLGEAMLKSLGWKNGEEQPDFLSEGKYQATGVPGSSAETAAAETGGWLAIGQFFLVDIVILLIGVFAIIALFAIFIAMIVRAVIIILLLSVSAAAFAAWIFPATEKVWKMWWEQFIKWCTFPIVFAFMLYIGITVINKAPIQAPQTVFVASIIQMILFSVFLVAGLLISLKSGSATATFVVEKTTQYGKEAGAWLGQKTTGAIKDSPAYQKVGQKFASTPLLKGVGQEMLISRDKERSERIAKYEKNYEGVTLSTLKDLEKLKTPPSWSKDAYEKRVALTNTLAKAGELSESSIGFIKTNRADSRFDAKAISEAVPYAFVLKAGKIEEAEKDIPSIIKNVANMKPNKIKEKVQASDLIKYTESLAKEKAQQEGKTVQEIAVAGKKAFEQTFQELVKTLSPAQTAAFWEAISAKDLAVWQDDIKNAIKKDNDASNAFANSLEKSEPLLQYTKWKAEDFSTSPSSANIPPQSKIKIATKYTTINKKEDKG
ncbi:MAG: hypothetical protein PHY96_00250 [Candidatus Pacebacteria bacterium]|nr:hypothetical protein [Candidatus Paceibacterota bacterium]MDD4998852.1 hypothetical protein [Candidatus Paceibacterota bacterium]